MTRRPAPFPLTPGARRSPLPALAVLGAIAVSLILAACGGSSPASSAASEQSREETRFADFAKCLREHGINAEAVAHGPGGGRGMKVSPRPGGPHGPQQFEAAQKACRRYQPKSAKANLSPKEKVEHEEQVQRFAKCMRKHGIKVEVTTQGGGVQIGIHAHPGAEGGPNPGSPSFQSAQQACQKLLPFKGSGPGPGGPPSTSKSGSQSGEAGKLSLSAGG